MSREIDYSQVQDLTLSQLQRAARAFGLELKIELTIDPEESLELSIPHEDPPGVEYDRSKEGHTDVYVDGLHVERRFEDTDVPTAAREGSPDARTGGKAPVTPAAVGHKPERRCKRCHAVLPETGKPGRKAEYCDRVCKEQFLKGGALEAVEMDATTSVPVVSAPAGPVCARCKEVGHGVLACPIPLAKKEKVAKVRSEGQVVRIDGGKVTVHELTAEERAARVQPEQPVIVEGTGGPTDEELSASAYGLKEKWDQGLPERVGYEYLPEVLALYGTDEEAIESCLRSPDRVEVRPESFNKDKRYPVLGFFKADVNVILGLRNTTRPCVIAVYVTSLLANDTHRVTHTGGGGAKTTKGLPKSPRQMVNRLRAMGCEVVIGIDDKTTEVTYQGQSLGKINVGPHTTIQQVQSDYQRCVRRVTGAKEHAS